MTSPAKTPIEAPKTLTDLNNPLARNLWLFFVGAIGAGVILRFIVPNNKILVATSMYVIGVLFAVGATAMWFRIQTLRGKMAPPSAKPKPPVAPGGYQTPVERSQPHRQSGNSTSRGSGRPCSMTAPFRI